MTALVDSGFLYTLLNTADRQHNAVTSVFAQTPGPWLLPTPALTEVAYLLAKFHGPAILATFLENLSESGPQLLEPHEIDYRRSAQLIRQYHDAPLDLVDSLVVAIAERLNVTTILTLDRRHFQLVRPRHCTAFEIFP